MHAIAAILYGMENDTTQPMKLIAPNALALFLLAGCSNPAAPPVKAQKGNCGQLADEFSELLQLTNAARIAEGVSPIGFDKSLGLSASDYAADLATQNFFSHTAPDGSSLGDRLDAVGYSFAAAGENLAGGQPTVKSVFEGWMDSPGHRANILDPRFSEVGFGSYTATTSDYGRYWVQHFGDRSTGQPVPYIPSDCGDADAVEPGQVEGLLSVPAWPQEVPEPSAVGGGVVGILLVSFSDRRDNS